MKKNISVLICMMISLISNASYAEEKASEYPIEPSGSFDITSNYIWRGLSLSDNLPSVQGAYTLTLTSVGAYVNLFGSSVRQFAEDGTVATVELDTVAGIANSIGKLDYDISFVRYNYPKATLFNYNELIGVFTFSFLTGTIGYSNNVFNLDTTGIYYNLTANIDIPPEYIFCLENVSVSAGAGHYDLGKEAGNSYNDYAISLNKEIKNYAFSLQWADTNHRFSDDSLDHSHLYATITATF